VGAFADALPITRIISPGVSSVFLRLQEGKMAALACLISEVVNMNVSRVLVVTNDLPTRSIINNSCTIVRALGWVCHFELKNLCISALAVLV
jgi:riboflavin synthase